ncbi:MAG: nuclease-related domain-containing protein [bacterium]|nr:nuclease-related domain-containing protein [bacterium]
MTKYFGKLFSGSLLLFTIFVLALANWRWPLYLWLGDTAIYRFIWLGLFFIFLDIVIEIILGLFREFKLIAETISFSKDLHKISDSFYILTKVTLSNDLKADFVVVGSSGVWIINVKDDSGKVDFNGDDLVQEGVILKRLLTQVLEKSYYLADILNKKLGHSVKVAPVLVFSSPRADLATAPKMVRGVYISSRQNVVSLIENTDFELIDKNTIEEINKLLKKK